MVGKYQETEGSADRHHCSRGRVCGTQPSLAHRQFNRPDEMSQLHRKIVFS